MASKRVHIFYSGRVQGVGFRFTAEAIAHDLSVVGWVRNLRDGRVEVIAEGEQKMLKVFLEKIAQEMSGYINDTDVSWTEPTGEFDDFGLRSSV
ncbi:MAG: hypothetical protein AMJ78_05150 [Omnitrophica WOR_2 bacterium SM23_29]|nr:MAG: hypothetical protein AMJ78_05150 [Omnitrophica WOR_2 bacterium SM23_29]